MQWKEVITFWFEETPEEKWFKKDTSFDKEICERFSQIHEDVARRNTLAWQSEPEGRLAEIIVLDQFSRNMFRDTAKAFAYDDLALTLAKEGVREEVDQKTDEKKRAFFYMPYMHSESKEDHVAAVELFDSLSDKGYLKYEYMHKDIIDQFGRYPHRNEVLGRTSTPEEKEFLKTHSGF